MSSRLTGNALALEIGRLLDAEDGRTIPEMVEQDDDHADVVVEKAERDEERSGTTVSWNGGTTTFLKGPEVRVGDTVRLYGGAFVGDTKHGWALNGELVEWQTPLERCLERLKWLTNHDRKKRERLDEGREKLDRQFAALPEPLRDRIERFRSESPSFRVDSEGYEMFCCTEAARFAEAARAAVAAGETDAADAFWADDELRERADGKVWAERPEMPEQRWLFWAWALNSKAYDYDYKRQKELLSASDEHSGNTFGGAMHLAYGLLEGRDL